PGARPAPNASTASLSASKAASPSRTGRALLCGSLAAARRGQAGHLLQALEASLEIPVLDLQGSGVAAQRRVRLPPVDPHLLRALDRCDEQAELDREELDVKQVDLDVSGDNDPLVQHALEDVGEVRGTPGGLQVH